MKYQIGDKIYCKIRGNTIISSSDNNYDIQLAFDIIGIDNKNSKYIVLVPKHFNIKNCWRVTEEHVENFGVDPNYLDKKAIFIYEDKIDKPNIKATSKVDGMACSRCKDFLFMAGPNQEDGSFKCFSCRENPYR